MFFEPSAKMKIAAPLAESPVWALIKDRFESCPPGKSFFVQSTEAGGITLSNLRTVVSRRAKKAGKTFRVVKHDGQGQEGCDVYEIGHIAAERNFMRAEPIEQTNEEGADNE